MNIITLPMNYCILKRLILYINKNILNIFIYFALSDENKKENGFQKFWSEIVI